VSLAETNELQEVPSQLPTVLLTVTAAAMAFLAGFGQIGSL
jgi:hypothetical protein